MIYTRQRFGDQIYLHHQDYEIMEIKLVSEASGIIQGGSNMTGTNRDMFTHK